MKIKISASLNVLLIIGLLIFSFTAGCILKEAPDEKSKQLQTGENILSDNDRQNISQDNNSGNYIINTENIENISFAEKAVQADFESQYTPLWKAGIIASDIDGKSYCLITKYIPETSEYYIQNVLCPPKGSPYISKDTSFGGMGTKYP
ncbi:MAG: hypothetical protein PHV39_03130, partial [Methanomicrobium sp.]|nr:hypothetical protein [Methanomicrobium sp.]